MGQIPLVDLTFQHREVADEILSLPIFPGISEEQQARVVRILVGG